MDSTLSSITTLAPKRTDRRSNLSLRGKTGSAFTSSTTDHKDSFVLVVDEHVAAELHDEPHLQHRKTSRIGSRQRQPLGERDHVQFSTTISSPTTTTELSETMGNVETLQPSASPTPAETNNDLPETTEESAPSRPVDCASFHGGNVPIASNGDLLLTLEGQLQMKLAHSFVNRMELMQLVQDVLKRKTSPLLAGCSGDEVHVDSSIGSSIFQSPHTNAQEKRINNETKPTEHEVEDQQHHDRSNSNAAVFGADFQNLGVDQGGCKTLQRQQPEHLFCDWITCDVSLFYKTVDSALATNEQRRIMMTNLTNTIERQMLKGDFDFVEMEQVYYDYQRKGEAMGDKNVLVFGATPASESSNRKTRSGWMVAAIVLGALLIAVSVIALVRYQMNQKRKRQRKLKRVLVPVTISSTCSKTAKEEEPSDKGDDSILPYHGAGLATDRNGGLTIICCWIVDHGDCRPVWYESDE